MDHDAQLHLPGVIPPRALAYLDAVRRYYGESKTRRKPRDEDIALLLDVSVRTWQRYKQELREGRDWLEGVWPPGPDWHPSWDPSSEVRNGETVLIWEERYVDGELVRRRLLNGKLFGHLSALAACLSGYVALDLRDGILDGVVHWCRVLLESVPHV